MLWLYIFLFVYVLIFEHVFWKCGGIGIEVEDNNKPVHRKVLSGGSIGLISGLIIAYIFLGDFLSIAIALTTFVAFLIGLYDDFKSIKIWFKVPLMLIPPIILVVASLIQPLWGHTTVFGIDFKSIYWILVVPIAYMGFSNGANIIAGYDGMEGGIYILILSLYIFISWVTGNMYVFTISLLLLLAIFAFEVYNIPPSKLILGNGGSFPIGGLLGVIPLIGGFEIVLPIVFAPHLIEFFFKIKYKGHTSVFGIVNEKGIIQNKDEKIKSVIHWIISWGNMNEKKITIVMLSIEALMCIIALFVWYLSYIYNIL
jgi:UDP-N-acetylglucosamine--dolichyl-phosphate N-acetylglucosaminephosphotransferase